MCRPDAFEVRYAINAWMDPTTPVDRTRALAQWQALHDTYVALGHRVDLVDPLPGQPDMVFAANGGVVVGDRAVGARFAHPERQGEAPGFLAWLRAAGWADALACDVPFEGEGDVVVAESVLLAGCGFRTDPGAHRLLGDVLGLPVLPLRLVDPRFYHLDTAVLHLGGDHLAWYPAALDAPSQALVRDRFPDAVEATEADALALGLNGWSDGRHVVLPAEARQLADALGAQGYDVVPADMSELRRAGGGPKCCTWEMHDARPAAVAPLPGAAATTPLPVANVAA